MKECPQCFYDVLWDSPVCALCGAELQKRDLSPLKIGADAPPRKTPPSQWEEEILYLKKQFQEKGVMLSTETLRRARETINKAQKEMPRVTALVVEISGASDMARKDSQPDASFHYREFYKTAAECILQKGGVPLEVIDNAFLFVFGAPAAFDNDTKSALFAALDIRRAFDQFCNKDLLINFRIGIATGTVRSVGISSPSGSVFHIAGGAAELAARLLNSAGAGGILACPGTWDIAERSFEAEPVPLFHLKDLMDDYIAYKILRIKPRRPEIQRQHFPGPFFGRKKELDALVECLSRKKDAGQRVIQVSGGEGIGKSRLVREAIVKAGRDKESIWWETNESASSILLLPVIEWLRREMNLSHKDSSDIIAARILEYFSKSFPEGGADPLLIEYLFGVPGAMASLRGASPERIQNNIFGLLRRLLFPSHDECREIILVADDAQWFDPLTIKFLKDLIDWPETSGLILILVYRTGFEPFIEKEKDHLSIHLAPLEGEERTDLLRSVVSVEEFLPEIRNFVLSRSAGNPLFLEEMANLVREVSIEYNHLNGEALTNKIIEIIPASLHDLIRMRINRLDERTRFVAQYASLLGKQFQMSMLGMFDVIQEGLEDHLHALESMNYLREISSLNGVLYFFTHGVFREAFYSTLLEGDKKRLHETLGRRLEEAVADRIPEYAELLAHHFSRAEMMEKAIYYHVKAGDRQSGLGEISNSIYHYSEAIELIETLPPHPGGIALMGRILIHLARLHRKQGDLDEAQLALESAMACAQEIDNPRLSLEARLELAILLVWKGEDEKAEGNLKILAEDAVAIGSPAAEMTARLSLGVLFWRRGRFEDALAQFQNLAKMSHRLGVVPVLADSFNNAGLIYWRWGQLNQALRNFKRALPLRRKICDRFGFSATLMNIGVVQEQMGRIEAARHSYQNALNIARETGYARGMAALESNLSNLDRRMGMPSSALVHAEKAVEYARRAGDPKIGADAEENAGLAHILLNQPGDSRMRLERAREIASSHKHEERTLSVRMSLLEVSLWEGSVKMAELDEVKQILSEIERLDYIDLKPHAYRLKAQILGKMNGENERNPREYLEMSRDFARKTGNVFEEMDTLRALVEWAGTGEGNPEKDKWRDELREMERMLGT